MRILLSAILFLNIIFADSLEDKADRLIKAYPNFFRGYIDNQIIWRDGEVQIFDDKKDKNFTQKLKNADLEDQFYQKYPTSFHKPKKNFDSGRYRNSKMFKKMYGKDKKEVERNLVTIRWMPKSFNKKIRVTKINGIDKKLIKISDRLDSLPKNMKKYLKNIGGTYKYRVISGTKRLSTHSFGIAIDINVKESNYWRWSKDMKYKNRIPKKIVKIFEKEGFIWGGKWYHYDTMHFEYRPELL